MRTTRIRRLAKRLRLWRDGNLQGCFDGLRGSTVAGWAYDAQDSKRRVTVELFEGRQCVAQTEAKIFRGDLKAVGIGDGFHGFEIVIPREFLDGIPHNFHLKIDGRLLLTRTGFTFRESPPVALHPLCAPRGWPVEGWKPGPVQPVGCKAAAFLEFSMIDSPDVSIIVPVHNKAHITYQALASLLRNPSSYTYEVIVVDDGSSDETLNICGRVGGITVVRHERAMGFVKSCNDGAALARGKFVVLLNNDVEVTEHWLDELLWPFFSDKKVGLVGAQLIFADGRLQEAGGIIWSNGAAWNYGRGGDPLHPKYNYTRDVDYASGACLVVPKSLWDRVGGFDPAFAPAYYEDTDLAFRIRQEGFRTLCAPLAKIFHYEGVSSGTDLSVGMKRFQTVNEPKFRKRWATEFSSHGKDGQSPDLEKDRGVQRRALVLDALTPSPDKDAGSYAAIQEIKLLQALGFKVTFASENLLHVGDYTKALQRLGVECLYAPYYRSFSEIFEQRGAEFSVIYITRYYVARKAIELARMFAPTAKVIMNNADLHFLRQLRAAVTSGDNDQLKIAKATREEELSVMAQVDLVLSYSDVEQAVILSHNAELTRVARCPWVLEFPPSIPEFEHRSDIAFLGSYGHEPNVDAVEYFVSMVMPILRRTLPGIRFRIYGSNASNRIHALASSDVVVEGYVSSVGQVYTSCRVFVAPLRSGAGIKGKVLGAFAHGVPCVLSPIAIEATQAREGIDALVAADPTSWATNIEALYREEHLWRSISKSSRALAERLYSFEAGLAGMTTALEAAGISGVRRNLRHAEKISRLA